MPDITLVSEDRSPDGTRAARRLRREDRVPAVVYGQGVAPTAVSVARRELRAALTSPSGLNAVITLTFAGQSLPTVVKALERDPVRRNVRHVDFLVVDLAKDIEVDVHLVIVGEAPEVRAAEGLVDLQTNMIRVSTTPRNIPTELEVDISGMTIGDTRHARDIVLPAGVALISDPDLVVLSAEATRATLEVEQPEGDEAAAGAGEAGEPAPSE